MEQAVVEEFINEVPYEIRAAIMELNNDARWAVYIALTLEGRKYFNEIKDEFKANPNTIGPILRDLVDGGLIAKKIGKFEHFADKRKVFYEPTNMGLRLFYALNEVIIPEREAPQLPRPNISVTFPTPTIDTGARRHTGLGERFTSQLEEAPLIIAVEAV